MNREKPYLYKRVIAYIIDLLVVTLLAGILTIILTNTESYDRDTRRILELTQKLATEESSNEEYINELRDLNYSLTSNSVNVTIITISVSIIYYVIMSYFCHGITLGKYMMKLRIVSANDKELNIFNYLVRALIINNILSDAVTITLVKLLPKQSFINISDKISNVFLLLLIVSIILIMYREDGRGLHDLLGNTKIINIKYNDDNKKKDLVQDAQIIEEVSKKKKEGK